MNKIKLLIAPNSFKECANATAIASIISRQFVESQFEIKNIPISDGGDGFLNVCQENFHLKLLSISAKSFYDKREIQVPVGISEDRTQIYLESADIIGMKIIPVEKRYPLKLNSENFGVFLTDLPNTFPNISKIILGLGGTATNDLGLGLCVPFGLKFFDKNGSELPVHPINYADVTSIKLPQLKILFQIEVVTDVKVPLFGDRGTSKTFAKQKGASEKDIELLEYGVKNIVSVLKSGHGIDFSSTMFGAGGGLLLGLSLIADLQIRFAEEFILNDLNLESEIKSADFIITGEGSFDEQSLMNKGTGIVINLAQKYGRQVFVICGRDESENHLQNQAKIKIFPIEKYFESQQSAIKNYKTGILSACKEIKSYILSHS